MLAAIKFAKCRTGAKIPSRSEGSAGLDVYACFTEDYIIIEPHETKLIPTGIKSAIDPGYFILLEERGSTGSKGIKRSAGVIDANFRGEWWVCIYNGGDKPICIHKEGKNPAVVKGENIYYPYEKAIAQALVLPTPEIDVEEWTEEEVEAVPSLRGAGQLGSSGK